MDNIDEVYTKIGQNIKKYREQKGYTQQQLADLIDMGINFVGKIEVAFSHPSIPTLVKIANALDIQISDLFSFEE